MTASRRPITRHLVIACSLAGLLLGVAPRASGPDTDVRRVKRQVYLMGTRATLVTLAPDRGTGLRQLEWMLQALESTEHELSTWDSDSLISRLNHHPVGQPWSAPAPLCELFDDVFRWYRDTGGAFDPAVGPLLDAWGTRQRGYRPTAAALADARARTGLGHFVFRPGTCDVTRVADASLDSGAFGKGAALDRVVGQGRARETAPWMIDLGGKLPSPGCRSTAAGLWRSRTRFIELRRRSSWPSRWAQLPLVAAPSAIVGWTTSPSVISWILALVVP